MSQLDELEALLSNQPSRPPIEKWNPDFSGDIDIHIHRDGRWFHEGALMERQKLVQLFASILRREADGDYYLVTPVEKWRIRVDDLPLQLVDMEAAGTAHQQKIAFKTNTNAWYPLDSAHRLSVTSNEQGEPCPALGLEHGLEGRVGRAVFYRLVDMAVEEQGELIIYSNGQRFSLGTL